MTNTNLTAQSDSVQEEWRPVVGWEGKYEVSSQGRIRSVDRTIRYRCGCGHGFIERLKKGQMLKPYNDPDGYQKVSLGGRSLQLHRLICETFNGPSTEGGDQVAHNDGIRNNNWPDNLRWATPKENSADQVRHGTRLRGENANGAKLTEQFVREIRTSEGVSNTDLAKRYGVALSQITFVKARRTWRHVPD